MSWTSPYFTSEEMACKCGCGEEHMDENFMAVLTELRKQYGKPLVVTSAYRCANHPAEAKKATLGAHGYGRAVDLAVQGGECYDVLEKAMRLGFFGIGVSQKGGSRFLHLDNMITEDGFYRPTIWSY